MARGGSDASFLIGVGLLGAVGYYLYRKAKFGPGSLAYINAEVDAFAAKYPFAGRDLSPIRSLINDRLSAVQPPG